MGELIQAKYLHLLRWKRFCEHTSAIESLYPYYQKRIRWVQCLQVTNLWTLHWLLLTIRWFGESVLCICGCTQGRLRKRTVFLFDSQINAEYKDCMERAQRLAVAKESLSQNSDFAAQSVKREDLIIYLRWLICQHHSVKKVNQYLTVCFLVILLFLLWSSW